MILHEQPSQIAVRVRIVHLLRSLLEDQVEYDHSAGRETLADPIVIGEGPTGLVVAAASGTRPRPSAKPSLAWLQT
jgi:hypothetical protein